ncbi:MAG: hypothetical protein EXQ91_01010 [Alphaproteobacteria bacterium]|nr:hypothetical protein [Alphaproteobacteria bacterium]
MSWTKSGRNIARWFIDLSPDDVVAYAAVTAPRLRGRGLRASFLPFMVQEELRRGARDIYCDVSKFNPAAMRNNQKQGWHYLAEVRARKTLFGRKLFDLPTSRAN